MPKTSIRWRLWNRTMCNPYIGVNIVMCGKYIQCMWKVMPKVRPSSYAFLLFSLSCPWAKLHDINKCMYVFWCSLPLAVLFVPVSFIFYLFGSCVCIYGPSTWNENWWWWWMDWWIVVVVLSAVLCTVTMSFGSEVYNCISFYVVCFLCFCLSVSLVVV